MLDNIFLIFTKLPKYLLTKKIKFMLTRSSAYKNFHALGYDKYKNSIMLFICKEAKQIQIIAGKDIAAKIKNNVWQNIIDEFTKNILNEDFETQILKTIDKICKVSINKIPVTKKSTNKISNEVVEIK